MVSSDFLIAPYIISFRSRRRPPRSAPSTSSSSPSLPSSPSSPSLSPLASRQASTPPSSLCTDTWTTQSLTPESFGTHSARPLAERPGSLLPRTSVPESSDPTVTSSSTLSPSTSGPGPATISATATGRIAEATDAVTNPPITIAPAIIYAAHSGTVGPSDAGSELIRDHFGARHDGDFDAASMENTGSNVHNNHDTSNSSSSNGNSNSSRTDPSLAFSAQQHLTPDMGSGTVARGERFSGPTPTFGHHQEERADVQDCAICLDGINPRTHAKATLACRHEFHLSCISMAFAMGKEMICPLCRYLHRDQPFMSLETDDGIKPSGGATRRSPQALSSSIYQSNLPFNAVTIHEHPTGGTVLSMMPSLFETTLGQGPAAGTIRTAPDGICLKTSTWLLLYAMPFCLALSFLFLVLGKVETMWSKVSCLIGAAICYMVCWGLVVSVMDPDLEARTILERLNRLQQQQGEAAGSPTSEVLLQDISTGLDSASNGSSTSVSLSASASTTRPRTFGSTAAPAEQAENSWSAWWSQQSYAQGFQNRMADLAGILDDLPDMMGEW